MTDLHEIVNTFYLKIASDLRRVLWLILKLLQISRTENCPFPPSYLQTNLIAAQKTNFSLQNCDSGSPVRGHKFWPDGARDLLRGVPGSYDYLKSPGLTLFAQNVVYCGRDNKVCFVTRTLPSLVTAEAKDPAYF